MALFWGQPCPLCGVKMTTEDRRFATTHFLTSGDLARYSDAVMHWDCYATWEHRRRFAKLYFDSWRNHKSNFWGVSLSNERVHLTVNPDKLVNEADLLLAETGSSFRVSLPEWEDFLAGEWFELCHHEVEREALGEVLPSLRSTLPTAQALIDAAGMEAKRASGIAAEGGMVARIMYEFACQSLAHRAISKGLSCPGCGTCSTNYDFVKIELAEKGPQSHLVCLGCGREFGPADV